MDNEFNSQISGYENAEDSAPPVFYPYGMTAETYAEKKAIRASALTAVLPSLAFLAFSFLWSFIYLGVMSALGYTTDTALKIIRDPAVLQILQIVISSLLFTIPFIIAIKVKGMRVSDEVPLCRAEKGKAIPYFLIGVSFCSFANIAVSYMGRIFESFGIDYSVDAGEDPEGFWGLVLITLATAAIPALVEEFAYRGVVFGVLKRHGSAFALMVSSALFGILHGNFEQIPFAFLVGLVLGFIRIKTGTLWVCIAVHSFNNLISVIFTNLPEMTVLAENTLYAFFLMVSLGLAICGVGMLSKQGEDYLLEESQSALKEKEKYKFFFTSPVTIIFIVACLVEACVYFI